LKRGKNDGCFEFLTSDCLVFGSTNLAFHISILLNLCIRHSYAPTIMCDVLFRPILKPSAKDRTDSGSYRAIAYGSIFLNYLK
jgi:hypothetical protein